MPAFDAPLIMLLLCALLGYGLGSIASGLILARVMKLGDLRAIGSGNIGATNVLRTGNKSAAALTLVFDALKGTVAVLLGRAIAGEDGAQVAALLAFLGHCYPVWLGFRGGKGVATFIGIVLALAWPLGLAVCATWLVTAALFRYSSLAALMAAGFSPLLAVLMGHGSVTVLCLVLAILIYIRHAGNIMRLRSGTEAKIGGKS